MPSFTTALKACAFLLATRALAVGCYSGGQSLPYDSDEINANNVACNVLSGSYTSGQQKTFCQTIGSNRIDFSVTASSAGSLARADCVNQNAQTAQGCNGLGGIRAFGVFDLTYDPNTGTC